MSSSIKVAVRCRPLLGQERPAGGLDIQSRRILLDSKTYDPDFTFPPTSSQEDVFQACRPILQCVKEGMNGTIMVYGQTGTGKTYTMLGGEDGEHGLVYSVVEHMLDHVQQKITDGAQCALTLSMIEIYNERLTDMLSPNGEEEVTLISGFPRFTHKVTLCRVNDAIETIQRGLAWRHTAATLMNERSSRSHVVFIFDMEEYNAFTEQTDVAHLFMIDLAGSESLKKSQASGVAAGEAGKINKSLLALKSVFLALSNTNEATRPTHVPYRDSKLTELLQDSIGGTARTLMIACISSVGRDIEETKSTLLYAVKARSIRNAANTEREKLLVRLRSMEVENQKLRNRLQERVSERGGYYVTKEEHEQTQEMTDAYDQLKEAVDQLTQDRQNSDARRHIWESQVKMLQALLADKEAELQKFKEIYHEALKRFEYQAAALQRMVRRGVGEAKDSVHHSFAESYARLNAWRTELLSTLEEPLPTALPPPLPPASCQQNVDPSTLTKASEEELGRHRVDESTSFCTSDAVSAVTPERRSSTPPPSQVVLGGGSQPQSQPAASRGVPVPVATGSPSRTAASAAAGPHLSRAIVSGVPYSARGSTASSFQRGSVASGVQSASISPMRRAGRPRHGGGGITASSDPRRCLMGNGRATNTLLEGGAAPLSPQLPVMDAPTQAGSGEYGGSTTATKIVDASAPGLISRTTSTPVSPPAWSTVMWQYDAQCLRTVHCLNDAVAAMLGECLQLFEDYKGQAELAESRRRRGIQEVCERLRSELDCNLKHLERVEAASQRDVQEARASLGDKLQLRINMSPLADATPLQLTVRDACAEVARQATHFFSLPSTPTNTDTALDAIVRNMQRCSTAFSLQSLDPLSSSTVGASSVAMVAFGNTTSSSSSASSPVVGRAMSACGANNLQLGVLAPMPQTLAPLERESLATAQLSSLAGSPNKEEALECSSLNDHPLQGFRRTISVSSPQRHQLPSTRPSSMRSSVALTAMPANRNRGGLNITAPFKRTRSTTASSTSSSGGAPPPARRATAPRRSGR